MHNCLKKSTFLTKFQFFFPKLAFLHKIDVEKNTRHFTPKIARHDFITGGKVFHLLENCYFDSKISFYYFRQKCHFPSKIYISGGINSLEKSSNFFEKGVNLDVNLENNDNWFQK